ncbi:uncharacterized protein LOC135056114 isoform X2 [Pseudophryne corroboree]|uniref:uncharacterized protein LOC135056114 isoform X2 n=1 Tax=Pseudophryne corroboree TaxID=495146 RepID=UPI00308167D1
MIRSLNQKPPGNSSSCRRREENRSRWTLRHTELRNRFPPKHRCTRRARSRSSGDHMIRSLNQKPPGNSSSCRRREENRSRWTLRHTELRNRFPQKHRCTRRARSRSSGDHMIRSLNQKPPGNSSSCRRREENRSRWTLRHTELRNRHADEELRVEAMQV